MSTYAPAGSGIVYAAPCRRTPAFLGLFIVPSVAQSILLTVVPLEALRLLATARAVTLLYVAAGLAAVAARLSIPLLVQLIRRRLVLSLGALLLIVGSLLLASGGVLGFACGLAFNSFAFACVEIASNLYLLDHIPRQELRRFEPARIFACAGPITFGPWFGVYLQQRVAFGAPFAIAAVAAMLLLILFWWLRLTELMPSRHKPPNPLRYLPRFFAQPRLRLAWSLAGARSAWWSTFYIYTPIFAVVSGLGAEAGGAIASIGTAWIFLVPLWGWVGRRYGLLKLIREVIPGVNTDDYSEWMGHRPALPDSLPVIGRSPIVRNAVFAFGHGFFGLIGAATTGRIVADLIAGQAPAIDLAPYRVDRF